MALQSPETGNLSRDTGRLCHNCQGHGASGHLAREENEGRMRVESREGDRGMEESGGGAFCS